jgi:hypothetical protein
MIDFQDGLNNTQAIGAKQYKKNQSRFFIPFFLPKNASGRSLILPHPATGSHAHRVESTEQHRQRGGAQTHLRCGACLA